MPGNLLIRLVIVVVFVVGSILGAMVLAPETEYLPDGNRNLVIAIMKPPPGYNVDQMIRLGDSIEPDVAKYWEAEPGSPEEAALDGPRIDNFFFVARGTMLFMGARSADPLCRGIGSHHRQCRPQSARRVRVRLAGQFVRKRDLRRAVDRH